MQITSVPRNTTSLENTAHGGVFISFEGIDGAGKSTHIQSLADAFERQGREVVSTREPGGTRLAETLRDIVLHQEMDSLTEALLMFAARRDHLNRVIEPALAKGAVVLCDRFTDATFAYQGGGRGFDEKVLGALEAMVQARQEHDAGIRTPDLTLWFDLDPQAAAARLVLARVPDKFESQPLDFFKRVRDGYKRRVCAQPWRFAVIDASQTRETVAAAVQAAVVQRGLLPHG